MNLKEDYHVHSNYNDHSAADLTIQNVVRHAENIGLRILAFTEHVRKIGSSNWIPRYLKEIESCKSSIEIIPGFEGKILPDGSIDCPKECSKDYFLIASFHSRFKDKRTWLDALSIAIQDPYVDVLGHLAPEETFTVDRDEIEELASLIVANKKIIELNAKYHRPPKDWIQIFKKRGVFFHLGSDAHSLAEVGHFESISDLINIVNASSLQDESDGE
jgi:putative hydrolase